MKMLCTHFWMYVKESRCGVYMTVDTLHALDLVRMGVVVGGQP